MKTQTLKIITLLFLGWTLAACEGESLDTVNNTMENPRNIHLSRHLKQVKRYDCEDKVISDQVEMVYSPTKLMTIRPSTYQNINTSHFVNESTNDRGSLVLNHNTFTIDMDDNWLNMQVREGLNKLTYEFTFCTQNENAECIDAITREQGEVYIFITYEVTHLEGVDTIKPTELDCNPTKDDAPSESQKQKEAK